VANLISVPFQNNFNFGLGPNDVTQWVLNVQPVIPIPLNKDWNLITRTINQPSPATGIPSAFGLGDSNPSLFLSPANSGKLISGAGPTLTFPTATASVLGSGKWQAGPALVLLTMPGHWVIRALANNNAMAHAEANSKRFESIEAKLDELRSYLYANRESVRGYAEAYRNGERISTAHVEFTVNQLINWRMRKKKQMGWSRAGAQYLLHVKTVIINGRLDRYTGRHSAPANMAA
jgi:hypothetical protein